MFVPISDENPLKLIRFGYVTLAIIVINIIVFLAFQLPDILAANDCGTLSFASVYGLVPIEFRGVGHLVIEGCPPVATSGFPEPLTIISYMFLHGDFWHILFNMLFLWVFGDNVEDALGHARFAVFYLLCGIAGAMLHVVLAPDSNAPLIGASGAISGVIAAYLMLHPKVHLWVLVFRIFPLKLYAWIVLGLWIAMNVFFVLFPPGGQEGQVAWLAHVGGLIAGGVLVLFMRRRGVPLFDNTSFETTS